MIASLPMYDTASTKAANDRLWQGIRAAYGSGPHELDRDANPHDGWVDPHLLFSQTCGLPYRSELHGIVNLIGTPDFGLEGCPPGYYYSYIVVRAEDDRATLADFATARLARNDVRSQSGWAAIENHLSAENLNFSFASNVLNTGSHALSVKAVAEGRADVAAIDAVTWHLLERDRPSTLSLRVLDRTKPTPGLPYITGPKGNPERLFNATRAAIEALSLEDQRILMLKGITAIPAADYLSVPTP